MHGPSVMVATVNNRLSRPFSEVSISVSAAIICRDDDELACFCRGHPLAIAKNLVTHGCPLSIACKILRNGFKVGSGRHKYNTSSRSGVFCRKTGDLLERLRHARDRSTTSRDTEWAHGPSGWSVRCVIAFHVHSDEVLMLGDVGGCKKSVIQAPQDSILDLPQDIMLCLHPEEYKRMIHEL